MKTVIAHGNRSGLQEKNSGKMIDNSSPVVQDVLSGLTVPARNSPSLVSIFTLNGLRTYVINE
jgi:hypothetical protein